jgi:GMP synthase PP-ATPase subunit
LHFTVEGWVRWSNTVCGALRGPGPMSSSRVAAALADGLAGDPLFCNLLANLYLHPERGVDLDKVVEMRQRSVAVAVSIVDAIEQALPALGRAGARDLLLAA